MRAISNAILQFRLVSIAVKVYSTSSPQQIGFSWITKKGNKVHQKLFDAQTHEEVLREDVLSGYEIEKDRFIVFSKEEVKLINKQKIAGDYIEVCEAVKSTIVAIRLVEKSYYLIPDKSDRAYRVLYQSLRSTRLMLIAKWFRANKDHLVIIIAEEEFLMMYQIYYQNEINEMNVSYVEGSQPTQQELKLAKVLLSNITNGVLDLGKYQDEYRARVLAAIEEKKKTGRPIYSQQQIEDGGRLLDLVELLKKSIGDKDV